MLKPLRHLLSDVFHVAIGLLSVFLGIDIPMTVIFCLYQYVDYVAGEPAEDILRDMIEYGGGLLIGAIARWALAFINAVV